MKLNEFRTLGRSGLRVSPITLGAMTFGDGSRGADDETSVVILDRYLEDGGNFIDTANAYDDGRSEETIGAYLDKHPGLRDRLVIATKFAANMFHGDPNGGGAGRKSDHASGRGVAAPAAHRLHRPVLAAPVRRPHAAHTVTAGGAVTSLIETPRNCCEIAILRDFAIWPQSRGQA